MNVFNNVIISIKMNMLTEQEKISYHDRIMTSHIFSGFSTHMQGKYHVTQHHDIK
jgi:hypothetical protein